MPLQPLCGSQTQIALHEVAIEFLVLMRITQVLGIKLVLALFHLQQYSTSPAELRPAGLRTPWSGHG